MTDKRIQAAAVREICGGVSDMWLWRRLHDDATFPRPIYISKRRFWREADVIDWLEQKAATTTHN
jgi:predicted DNA-binding transcriptional regulator AlpA